MRGIILSFLVLGLISCSSNTSERIGGRKPTPPTPQKPVEEDFKEFFYKTWTANGQLLQKVLRAQCVQAKQNGPKYVVTLKLVETKKFVITLAQYNSGSEKCLESPLDIDEVFEAWAPNPANRSLNMLRAGVLMQNVKNPYLLIATNHTLKFRDLANGKLVFALVEEPVK